MPLLDDLLTEGRCGREFLADVEIHYCATCHVSQNLYDTDLGEHYQRYTYTVSQSAFALQFMSLLARSLFERYQLREGARVLEVGSGDGAQLLCFQKLGASVYGIEPSSGLCAESSRQGIPTYEGVCTRQGICALPPEMIPADVLLLTYTFDHMPDPREFLTLASEVLHPDNGLLVIEVHDLEKTLARKEYCLFAHEHTIYLSLHTMQTLLLRAGFVVLSADIVPESQRRGNSLLVVAAPASSRRSSQTLPVAAHSALDEWASYEAFQGLLESHIQRLDEFVERQISAGLRLAGYGVGRAGNTLAAMNRSESFRYICDQNSSYHGRLIPKTHIPVVPPEWLLQEPVDVLLVFSYGYLDEIREMVEKLVANPPRLVSLVEV